MYADYGYYTGVYMGNASEEEYTRIHPRAAAEVRRMIFGREPGKALDSVRMAECAVLDELISQESGGAVASESNDGISVSYATVVRSHAQRLCAAADVYLDGTGLNVMAI